MNPSTSLYRRPRNSQYVLQRWYQPPDSGVIEASGEVVYLSQDAVRNKGLDIVLIDLAGFPTRKRAVSVSPEQRKRLGRLLRECDEVCVSLHLGDELWLDPIVKDGRGRGTGFAEDRLFLSLPSTNKKFFALLEEAYQKCSRVYR